MPSTLIPPERARELEPAVSCVEALHVPGTGVVDFVTVAEALVRLLEQHGADLRRHTEVVGIGSRRPGRPGVRLHTTTGDVEADAVVNCAGPHSDRLARLAGLRPAARIVPFRGEFHRLTPTAAHLVRRLVSPVPDPGLPFLGVHLTRGVDGEVLAYPGFWRLARRHAGTGAGEVVRSLSRRRFAAAALEIAEHIADRLPDT